MNTYIVGRLQNFHLVRGKTHLWVVGVSGHAVAPVKLVEVVGHSGLVRYELSNQDIKLVALVVGPWMHLRKPHRRN